MQTIANQIKTKFDNFTDALTEADKLAVEDDQDYEQEITILTFKDGSKLKFDGLVQEIN